MLDVFGRYLRDKTPVDDITVMMAPLLLLLLASVAVANPTSTFGLEENLLWEKFKLQVS